MVDPIRRVAEAAAPAGGLPASATAPPPGPGKALAGPGRSVVWKLCLVGAALAVLYALNFGAIRAVTGPDGRALFRYYPLFFGILFALYLVGVYLSWNGGRRVALALIVSGMAFRLVMLPTDVVLSSDLYRYLWDGRVQVAGVNPFRYAPQDEALAFLRDAEIHPSINRPAERTIYPPGSQVIFAVLAWLAPNRIGGLRLLLIACDLATMLLLLRLFRRLGLPEGRVAVYAWAPLPIFEFAQAAHMDATFIPLVLGAVLARLGGRPALAGSLLGGAALIKLYPAILLPALWQPRARRLPVAFLGTVALGYLPYAWGVGEKVTGFLPEYFGRPDEDFNIGLRYFLTEGIGLDGHAARTVAMVLLALALTLALVFIGRRRPDTPLGIAGAAGLSVGTYILLVPTSMQPWYVAWLVPFLVLVPGASWWYVTGAITLSYLKYGMEPEVLPLWARALEWLLAYVLVLRDLGNHAARRPRAPAAGVRLGAPPSSR